MALFGAGPMSATKIAQQINVSRTSIYDLLERLMQKGLVAQTMQGGVKMFVATSPEKISLLLEEKEKDLARAKKDLDVLATQKMDKQKTMIPRLQLFEGRKELQQMMKDLLLYRDITLHGCWPILRVAEVLGEEFLEKFNYERIDRNIKIKVVWPAKQIPTAKKYPYLTPDQTTKREVRIAPAGTDFSLGYTFYKNIVRFISSKRESFGFLIESYELTEMMRSQFEIVWQASKPLK